MMDTRLVNMLVLGCVVVLYLSSRTEAQRRHGCEIVGCCDGKNNTCFYVPSKGHRCFCDSYCDETKDCCRNYYTVCTGGQRVPVDCSVTKWGKWSECSDACGRGRSIRSRKIVVPPKYNGKACPRLLEKRSCFGRRCFEINEVDSQAQERDEIGRILPAEFGIFRSSKMYDPYQDIRKNLFSRISNEVPPRPAYCSRFKIVETNSECNQTMFAKKWANVLQPGAVVCAECQPFAMSKAHGMRCRGHGVLSKKTHWNAVDVRGCFGKWVMLDRHSTCTCNVYGDHDFILL